MITRTSDSFSRHNVNTYTTVFLGYLVWWPSSLTSDLENLFGNEHSHDDFVPSFIEIHPLYRDIVSRRTCVNVQRTDGRRKTIKHNASAVYCIGGSI